MLGVRYATFLQRCHGARSDRPGKQSRAAALLARRASRFHLMVKLRSAPFFLLVSSSFVLYIILDLAIENARLNTSP